MDLDGVSDLPALRSLSDHLSNLDIGNNAVGSCVPQTGCVDQDIPNKSSKGKDPEDPQPGSSRPANIGRRHTFSVFKFDPLPTLPPGAPPPKLHFKHKWRSPVRKAVSKA